MDSRARRRVMTPALALLLALLLAWAVLGRGPGTVVWLLGAPPPWLPFAGAGLTWLPLGGSPQPVAGKPVAAASPPPAALATPTPTPRPPAATPAPTPARTPAPTPKPTAAPTPTPARTPTPVPSPVTLFADNFEQDTVGGQPGGWTVDSGPFTIASDGSKVVSTTATNWAVAHVGSSSWRDYSVTASVKDGLNTGHARLIARYQGPGYFYYCGLNHELTLSLGMFQNGSEVPLASTSYSYDPNVFYTVVLTVKGSALTCAVTAGGPAATVTASQASYAGGGAGILAETPAEFDNFAVRTLV